MVTIAIMLYIAVLKKKRTSVIYAVATTFCFLRFAVFSTATDNGGIPRGKKIVRIKSVGGRYVTGIWLCVVINSIQSIGAHRQ